MPSGTVAPDQGDRSGIAVIRHETQHAEHGGDADATGNQDELLIRGAADEYQTCREPTPVFFLV